MPFDPLTSSGQLSLFVSLNRRSMQFVHHATSGDDPDDEEPLSTFLTPIQADQMIRHSIHVCWMALPKERRTVDELDKQVRRFVDRALRDFREDNEAFGGALGG
jgi:Asp-tRNA(Asn)/Glu-tRNA(Gln) amidotransferase A subunit family amidase